MLTAYAMCLECTPDQLVKEIGHDGSEIIWPDRREPLNRRGFHIQEMNYSCMRRGYGPIWWDRQMLSNSVADDPNHYLIEFDLENHILSRAARGVVFNGNHAWAWDGLHLYNPSGHIEEHRLANNILKGCRTFCQLFRAN